MRVKANTWEPDFLVTLRGQAAVLEVDGHVGHDGRRAAERSKDRIYEDSGVKFIEHVDVETTDDPEALEQFIGRFVRRLAGD